MERGNKACIIIFLALSFATTGRAQADTVGAGFGNAVEKISESGVAAQFLSFPLPMTNYLKGDWKVGLSGGYSKVDGNPGGGGPASASGPEFSAGLSYAWTDHWGLYVPIFNSILRLSGGGVSNTGAAPGSSNPPFNFTNVSGTVHQTGAGVLLIWDPFVSGPNSSSMPIGLGVIVNQIAYSGVQTNYQSIGTPSDHGVETLAANSSLIMPVVSIEYGWNAGKYLKLTPSAMLSGGKLKDTDCGPSNPMINGGKACLSHSVGYAIFAPGLTATYRPWGLSTNIGATIYSAALHGNNIIQANSRLVKSSAFYSISWAFGKYEK